MQAKTDRDIIISFIILYAFHLCHISVVFNVNAHIINVWIILCFHFFFLVFVRSLVWVIRFHRCLVNAIEICDWSLFIYSYMDVTRREKQTFFRQIINSFLLLEWFNVRAFENGWIMEIHLFKLFFEEIFIRSTRKKNIVSQIKFS